MTVSGEVREDINERAALGFHSLAVPCDPLMDPCNLYKQIAFHLSDSVSQNKFLHEDVLFNLDHSIPHIFFATFTSLGFCPSLKATNHKLEDNSKINNLFDGFIV